MLAKPSQLIFFGCVTQTGTIRDLAIKTSTIQNKGSAGAWRKDASNFERERVISCDNEILVTGLHGELTEGTICQLQKPRSAMGDITPMTHTLTGQAK
jgi:hypothetical protein